MRACTDQASVPKEFWENVVRIHVNSKGKIPSTGKKKSPQRRIEPTALHQAGQRAQHTTNELFRPPVQGCLVRVGLLACLTTQQHASVSQGRICSDSCTCCHTEIDVADQTFHLALSQYTDTGSTSPRADPTTPGAWQGSHWGVNF